MAAAFYRAFAAQRPILRAALDQERGSLIRAQAERARSKQSLDVAVDWSEVEGLMQAEVLALLQAIYLQAGVSAQAEIAKLGLVVNWEIFDVAARDRATTYGYGLIKQISDSTRQQIGQTIARWIETPDDFEALVEDIWKLVPTNPFPNMRDRARVIAQTETTRVYADSRIQSFKAAGLHQMEWRTANDELVCPRCGPLNGRVGSVARGILNPDDGQYYTPPAHVGCRCWLVESAAEMESQLAEQG